MEENTEITFEMYQSFLLWFNPATEAQRILQDGDPDTRQVNCVTEYDYAKVSPGHWRVFLDLRFEVETIAYMGLRCGFEALAPEENVFSTEAFEVMLEATLEIGLETFETQRKAHNLEPVSLQMEDFAEYQKNIATDFAHSYFEYRQADDHRNENLMGEGVRFTAGSHTSLILHGTFMIVDQVLFLNPNFNHSHNQNVFTGIIPLVRYNTLKLKTINIASEEVAFSWLQVVYFLLAMDAALQLMVGDHLDAMTDQLEALGLTEPTRVEYLKQASNMLAEIKEDMRQADMQIVNLEQVYDWNSLIMQV